jgi:hypothetical protein
LNEVKPIADGRNEVTGFAAAQPSYVLARTIGGRDAGEDVE